MTLNIDTVLTGFAQDAANLGQEAANAAGAAYIQKLMGPSTSSTTTAQTAPQLGTNAAAVVPVAQTTKPWYDEPTTWMIAGGIFVAIIALVLIVKQ